MKEIEKALDWVALNRALLWRQAEEESNSLAAEILVLEQLVRLDPGDDSPEFPGLTILFLLKVEMYHQQR